MLAAAAHPRSGLLQQPLVAAPHGSRALTLLAACWAAVPPTALLPLPTTQVQAALLPLFTTQAQAALVALLLAPRARPNVRRLPLHTPAASSLRVQQQTAAPCVCLLVVALRMCWCSGQMQQQLISSS
jgi:hypothetical protein